MIRPVPADECAPLTEMRPMPGGNAALFRHRSTDADQQLDRFPGVTEELKAAGYPVGLRHIANSCAALRFLKTRLDAVRVGNQYALIDAAGADIRPGGQVEWDGNLMLSSCERRFT